MATTITLERAITSNQNTGNYGYGLPSQTVPIAEKETDEWKRASMNFFVNESRSHDRSRVKDIKKYKMLSDQYDYKDHQWAIDPLNLGSDKEEKYGSTDPIQHYPIVNTPLNTILGERISRKTQWLVVSDCEASMNEFYRTKTDMLMDWVQGTIINNETKKLVMTAQKNGQEVNEELLQQIQQQLQAQPPKEIERYMDDTYTDVIEGVHNRILKNLVRRNDLESEFIEGFRHGTIVGREYYAYQVINNKLKIFNLSPFSVFSHRSPSCRWVSEGQYAGYRLFLTPSSIIDNWRDKLQLEDIEILENKMNPGSKHNGYKSLSGIKSISYNTSVFSDFHGNTFDNVNVNEINGMIDEYLHTGNRFYDRSTTGLFEVVQAYWKSYRKVGILETFLPGDEPIYELVDENYEPDKSIGEEVKWYYLNQVYQGTDVAGEFLIDVGPYPFQIFDPENPDYCPLPIEGGEYNSFNGTPMALMDLMMPWGELYDIVANELKKDLKKSNGQVMYMSIDNIPNVEGFDMNKWMYWCKEFGIAWVGNNGKNQNSFSHYQSVDMSQANQIQAKMNLLDKIKMNCDSFAGFSQNRVAGQSNAPTQGQDQQKLISSANQTEYYFWKHSKISERVLTLGLNIEKMLVRKRKDKSVLFDDIESRFIDTDIEKATMANTNLWVVNNSELLSKRELLRQMATNAAAKTGMPEDMGDIIMADTLTEINKSLRRLSRKNAEQAARQQQIDQQKFETEMQNKEEDRAWEKEKHYSTLQSEERQEYMRTFINQENNLKDEDKNGIADILERDKHFENVINNVRKNQLQQTKIDNENKNKSKELDIKKEEVGIKKKKNEIDLKNQENDLAIARLNAKNRTKSG